MEQSSFLLRQIIDTSLDAVITINQEGVVTEWNKQAERIFGFSRTEALDVDLSDLIIPPALVEAHNRGMRHFMKTGEGPVLNKRIEIRAIDRNKREFPVELTINPIRVDGVYIFSAFIRDISERKKAENALIQAKKEAEEARHTEIQLLTNISHEIRTPMNSVLGSIHLLDNSDLNKKQQNYLTDLVYSANHLMGLINNILDYSKIKTDNLEIVKVRFSLNKLLLNINQSFQKNLKNKQIDLELQSDKVITNYVIGDEYRLQQILSILIGIHIDHTSKGKVQIHTTLLESFEKQHFIQFDVSGIGGTLVQRQINRILKDINNAESQTFSKYGNTGLSLVLVIALAELLKGTFNYESQDDNQLLFQLKLPVTNSGVKIEESVKQTTPNSEKQLTDKRILVVEDNPMNQAFMGNLLGKWGCNFELVANGLEAVNKLQQQTFDVVLMDIHMPLMNGIEATKRIRSFPTSPNQDIPIIALSAGGLKKERSQAIEAGVNEFLSKPFFPDRLFQIISELFINEIEIADQASSFSEVTLDLSYLRASCGNDHSFIREMLETFMENTPHDLYLLRNHLDNNDLENIYRTAHKLKASLMMIGLNSQQQLAQHIETLTIDKSVDLSVLESSINQLCTEIGQAFKLVALELGKSMSDSNME